MTARLRKSWADSWLEARGVLPPLIFVPNNRSDIDPFAATLATPPWETMSPPPSDEERLFLNYLDQTVLLLSNTNMFLEPPLEVKEYILTVKLYQPSSYGGHSLSDGVAYLCNPYRWDAHHSVYGLIYEGATMASILKSDTCLGERGVALKFLADPLSASMVLRVELSLPDQPGAVIEINDQDGMEDEEFYWNFFRMLDSSALDPWDRPHGEIKIFI